VPARLVFLRPPAQPLEHAGLDLIPAREHDACQETHAGYILPPMKGIRIELNR
jgi:hypothetical protein